MHIYSSIAISMNKETALFGGLQPTYHFFHENKTKTRGGKTFLINIKKNITQQMHD